MDPYREFNERMRNYVLFRMPMTNSELKESGTAILILGIAAVVLLVAFNVLK